jgi:hypothetical protein
LPSLRVRSKRPMEGLLPSSPLEPHCLGLSRFNGHSSEGAGGNEAFQPKRQR